MPSIKPAEPRKPVIERAFELARSGEFAKLDELEKALHREGYSKSNHQLMAPTLRKQLRAACAAARGDV